MVLQSCKRTEAPIWSERHDKEERYQQSHERIRKLEAVSRGQLLDAEVDADLQAQADALLAHKAKLRISLSTPEFMDFKFVSIALVANIRSGHLGFRQVSNLGTQE